MACFLICEFLRSGTQKKNLAISDKVPSLTYGHRRRTEECNAPRNQPRTDIVAQMFAFVKTCAQIFFRRCQGQLAALYTLDTPVKWEGAELDAHRTKLSGGAAAVGSGGAAAPADTATRSPRAPGGGGRGGGGRQGRTHRQNTGRGHAAARQRNQRSGRQHASTFPRGQRQKKGGFSRRCPRGGAAGPEAPKGTGQGGTGDPRKEPTEPERSKGDRTGSPQRSGWRGKGLRGQRAARSAQARTKPERISRGNALGPGADLGALRRIGTATAAAGAPRRSRRSTRNAGECRMRRAHKGRGTRPGAHYL